MKVLLVNKFLYPRGGAESYLLKVGAWLKQQGHEVSYFGMYDEKNTVSNHLHLTTSPVDFHRRSLKRLAYPLRILYSWEARRKIGRVLDDFRPDIVHLNNINFQLTPSIIDAIQKRGIPLVQTVHDYQMICPNHLLYDFQNQRVCERCVGHSKHACFTRRCIHGSRVKSLLGVLEAALYRRLGTYRKVDRFICPSRFLRDRLLEDNPALFEKRVTVLPNFVDPPKKTGPLQSRFATPYLAFAGRLSREKGTEILAQTARLLPQVRFVVMGSGPEEHAFDGLPNVTVTGFVTGEELQTNLACARALAVPSVCFENCPLAILEAQQWGVPSITMNRGGMAELVKDGVTGVLVNSDIPADFADAVRALWQDEEACRRMGENCRKAAAEALTLDRYGEKLLQIYKDVSNR